MEGAEFDGLIYNPRGWPDRETGQHLQNIIYTDFVSCQTISHQPFITTKSIINPG